MKLKQARTPLLATLQKAIQIASKSRHKTAPPVNEMVAMHGENSISRRSFIGSMGKTGITLSMGTLIGSSLTSCKDILDDIIEGEQGKPLDRKYKIAIVGAGIAGLNAAHQFKKQGIWTDIYEGSSRAGGRMRTIKNQLVQGLYADLGGEFVNSDHEDIIQLTREFGISMIDTANDSLIKDLFFIEGKPYSMEDAVKDLQPIISILEKDQAILEDYESPEFKQLDNTSLKAYIEKLPTSNQMKKLLEGAYVTEFGLDAEEQSPVYALYTIGTDTSEGLQLLAASDQRYKIKGGSQTLTDKMQAHLKHQIVYEHKLVSLREHGGKYTLGFENGKEKKADIVILAIPSSILKEVDIQLSNMDPEQKTAIQEMGFGQNAKLLMGFHQPIWRKAGFQGFIYGDKIQNGWDHTQMQNQSAGAGYTIYQGGSKALQLSQQYHNPQAAVSEYLPQLEKFFNNKGQHNGKSIIANWPDNPFSKGSYLCPKVGQMNQLELLGQPVDGVYFAGEHTSVDYQGYMNGGAESGRLVAEQIMEEIGVLS